MVSEADALLGYDTYPHIDLYEIGVKAARLLLRAIRGEVRPVSLFARVPMLVPAEGMATDGQPMATLLAEAKALEARPGVLSVSLLPVQPWLDIPGTGFSVLAVADGPRRAAELAPMLRQLGWRAWESRRAFRADLLPVDEAIARALALAGRAGRPLGVGRQHRVGLPRGQRGCPGPAPGPGCHRALPGPGGRSRGGGPGHRDRGRAGNRGAGRRRPGLPLQRPGHPPGPRPDPLRRPLHLQRQEEPGGRGPDGPGRRHRGRADRRPGHRAPGLHRGSRPLPGGRAGAGRSPDRGREVPPPVP